MNDDNKIIDLEKELDKIVLKILIPITDELKSKAKEIKQKRLDLKKEIYNNKQLKLSLIEKRKKLNKKKLIYEKHMNGDFSNTKLCEDYLKNYINIIDKKQNDFLKDKDDYYELKLRKKKLEFDNILLDLITEKSNIGKKKKLKRKLSFEPPKRLNQSTHSIHKSMISNTSNNSKSQNKSLNKNKNKNINKSITPKVLKSEKNNKNKYKDTKINKNIKRKNSNESNSTKNNEIEDVSGEIEKLISDYSSTKNGKKAKKSQKYENFSDGLKKMKEINKDTQKVENDLKELMIGMLNKENES